MNNDKQLSYLHAITKSVEEIDEIVDGEVDIDNNGNANTAMKVQIEVNKLRFSVRQLRELIEQAKRIADKPQPQTPLIP